MTTKANDINTIETKFRANLGNGIKAGEYLRDMIKAVVSSRDTTIITRNMALVDKNKQDSGALTTIRTIVGQVYPGAKLTKQKDGQYKLKISGIEADNDALARLDTAVERGLSIRHATFRQVVAPKPEAEDKEYDAKAAAERFYKAHPDKLEAMIAALQALRTQASMKKAA